jgi:hypothetical protein
VSLVIVPAILFPISFVSLVKSKRKSKDASHSIMDANKSPTIQSPSHLNSNMSYASNQTDPSPITTKAHIFARLKGMGPILLGALCIFLIPIVLISSGIQIGSLSTQRIACAKLGFLSTQSDKCLNDMSMAMQTSYYELLMNITLALLGVFNGLLCIVDVYLNLDLTALLWVPLWSSVFVHSFLDIFLHTQNIPDNPTFSTMIFVNELVVSLMALGLGGMRMLQEMNRWVNATVSIQKYALMALLLLIQLSIKLGVLFSASSPTSVTWFMIPIIFWSLATATCYFSLWLNVRRKKKMSKDDLAVLRHKLVLSVLLLPFLLASLSPFITSIATLRWGEDAAWSTYFHGISFQQSALHLVAAIFFLGYMTLRTRVSFSDVKTISAYLDDIHNNSISVNVRNLKNKLVNQLPPNFKALADDQDAGMSPSTQTPTTPPLDQTTLTFMSAFGNPFVLAFFAAAAILLANTQWPNFLPPFCRAKLQNDYHQCSYLVHDALRALLDHGIFEWLSILCCSIIVGVCILHYLTFERDLIIFYVLAHWGSLLLDGVHTFVSFRLFPTTDLAKYIPFSWSLARLFHSFILSFGVWFVQFTKEESKASSKSDIQEKMGFMVTWAFIMAAPLLYAQYLSGTTSYLPPVYMPAGSTISRPYEFAAFAFYLVLFAGLLTKNIRQGKTVTIAENQSSTQSQSRASEAPQRTALGRPKKMTFPSIFEFSLLLASMANIIAQLHMALGSKASFDAHFNAAHFFKLIGYAIPATGAILEVGYAMKSKMDMQHKLAQVLARTKGSGEDLSEMRSQQELNRINQSLKHDRRVTTRLGSSLVSTSTPVLNSG